MKKIMILFYLTFLGLVACTEDPEPVVIDPTKPQGNFNVLRMGNFTDQNGAGSTGSASLGTDEEGSEFLQFGNSFNTALATGTVTVFLSTSDTFMADPGNGNPDLLDLGVVRNSGTNYFLIPSGTSTDKFSHVILWCGSVGIPFGNAPLN